MKKPRKPTTETKAERDKREVAATWWPHDVLEDFSVEQRQMIDRLSAAIGSKDQETVYELAAAALWVLGLDPIARDSFDRLSNIVLGKDVDAEVYNRINDMWEASEAWTLKQRSAERGAAIREREERMTGKGRAA